MSHEVVLPPPVTLGDRVAVVSPSWAGPEMYPEVHEQAMRRIRELGLEPVELATTRRQGTPAERAADLHAAFGDPSIRAVLSTIGGDDQITVLPHLDPAVMTADPKRFLGYSDCTNLSNWLWWHGVGGIYGGSTMVHLGPGPEVDPLHLETLRAALFGGDVELREPTRTRDVGLAWDDPAALTTAAPDEPAEPWTWSGAEVAVTGPVWGGCLEILEWTAAVGRWMRPVEDYRGCVLALETSEERPTPEEVFRMLRNLGERGILGVVAGLVWGRPPVSGLGEEPASADGAAALRDEHRAAVLRAVEAYHPGLPVVMDVDVGHTIPQLLLPYGGAVTLDGVRRRIVAHYG